jgi:hypothetical protein
MPVRLIQDSQRASFFKPRETSDHGLDEVMRIERAALGRFSGLMTGTIPALASSYGPEHFLLVGSMLESGKLARKLWILRLLCKTS